MIYRISKPALPLSSYKEESIFKLFFLDVGLLAAASNLDPKAIIDGHRVFQEFKGALTEQYVQQQLIAEFGLKPYYWTSKSGQAEVDFMAEFNSGIYPIEAKAERNLQSKSLKVFCSKHFPEIAFRISMSHYYRQEVVISDKASKAISKYILIDLPLYAINQLENEINAKQWILHS